MESKALRFHLFRYHLLPLTKNTQQIDLFPEEDLTPEFIRAHKNDFFNDVLLDLPQSRNSSNPLKLHNNENPFWLFKLANKKIAFIAQNFEMHKVPTEPFLFVAINNNPEVQLIAISENLEAFSSPTVVRNILRDIFQKDLRKYGLNIEIEQLIDQQDFWKYIHRFQNKLTKIDFEFIKPNMANISGSLDEEFRDFANSVNSHESHIIIAAPQNGLLENINQENPEIRGLIDYASEGGGNVKIKVKGVRKMYTTDQSPITVLVDEVSIEGAPEQAIKMYQAIVSGEPT